MESISKAMKKIISKCDVCINGNVISEELLMTRFNEFLSLTIEENKHNVGFVLHTGSLCFDALVLSYAAISNILYNNTNPEEIVQSLLPGDIVLYYNSTKINAKAQRYEFKEIRPSIDGSSTDMGPYVILEQGSGNKTMLPKSTWSRIVPYQGTSSQLDGRGLRKENGKRAKFFKSVLNMSDSEISRTINASTVVVMARDTSNELINGLSFKFDNEEIKFTELVTASYFTEGDQEYQYGRNAAKVEPVIKITGKVSVARKLLLRKDWNRNIGLIVLGEDSIKRGESELPELIDRKSIQYVYICTNIDSEIAPKLLSNYEKAALFPCTKEFLLDNSLPTSNKNPLTNQLETQINAIIDRDIETIELDGFIDWDEYSSFKRLMYFIKSYEYDSNEKEQFVIQAFSLMNLLTTIVFEKKEMDRLTTNGVLSGIAGIESRLHLLRLSAESFPHYLREKVLEAIKIIDKTNNLISDFSPKSQALLKLLKENYNKRIAIVVPKAYYVTILNNIGVCSSKIEAVTVNKFNNKNMYDLIVVVGNITGSKFDVFRTRAGQMVKILLYEPEKYLYEKKRKIFNEVERMYNRRSTFATTFDDEEPVYANSEIEVDEIDQIETEMSVFFGQSIAKTARSYLDNMDSRNQLADIDAIVKFDTEEVAFLTKNFKAYVLDEAAQVVNELKVSELTEGDVVVFTRSTSKTRDIVDGLLNQMVEEQRVSVNIQEEYKKSKHWKTTLIDYMKSTKKSPKDIADELIKNGVSVQEITIRGWLDEDSHTVGPRKMDSIQQIAFLSGDMDMFDHADVFFEACANIRKVRRQILDAIGKAILGDLTGSSLKKDVIYETVHEKIDELATVLQIESVTYVNDTVPINITNRPFSMNE